MLKFNLGLLCALCVSAVVQILSGKGRVRMLTFSPRKRALPIVANMGEEYAITVALDMPMVFMAR